MVEAWRRARSTAPQSLVVPMEKTTVIMAPRLDHVVMDVGDRMAEAAGRFFALGFHVTSETAHSLGTLNRLCVFTSDYLELLSVGTSGRADLASFPVGLNGLVFAMERAVEFHDSQKARGVPVENVQNFARIVDLPNGERRNAQFNVVRLESRAAFDGRLYFCEQLTPELVWRPEWQSHPNGARGLTRIALATMKPNDVADKIDRTFGPGAVVRAASSDLPHVLGAGTVDVEIWPHNAISSILGAAMPDGAGRADYVAVLGIRVSSIAETHKLLRGNGVPHRQVGADRILVLPGAAMNVALEFVAEPNSLRDHWSIARKR